MKLINISKSSIASAKSARAAGVNMLAVLDSQVELASEINKAANEINKALSSIPSEFDPSSIEKRVEFLEKKKPPQVNVSHIKAKCLEHIKGSDIVISQKGEAETLTKKIELLTSDFTDYKRIKSEEITNLKKDISLARAEIKSIRSSLGVEIDEIRQRANKLTEMK